MGYGFALLPAVIMIVMPMTALALMVEKFGISTLLGGTAAAMFLLGMFLMVTSGVDLPDRMESIYSPKPGNQLLRLENSIFILDSIPKVQ